MNTCARNGCYDTYIRKTHNQKYCSDECCRLATNSRIMEKYYAKRDQKLGKARFCKECDYQLNRYNSSLVCGSCELRKQESMNHTVLSMLQSALQT